MPNTQTKMTILALRPGKREMGMAVMEGDELLDWGILGFRQRDPQVLFDQVERRLTEQIRRHQPTVLAMEQPTKVRLQSSPMLLTITGQIRAVAEATGLPLRGYSPEAVRQRLCGSSQKTRRHLAEQIVTQYPHLQQYRKEASSWQESYWMPMYAAVAAALVCSSEMNV